MIGDTLHFKLEDGSEITRLIIDEPGTLKLINDGTELERTLITNIGLVKIKFDRSIKFNWIICRLPKLVFRKYTENHIVSLMHHISVIFIND